jgi:hypothetical protein
MGTRRSGWVGALGCIVSLSGSAGCSVVALDVDAHAPPNVASARPASPLADAAAAAGRTGPRADREPREASGDEPSFGRTRTGQERPTVGVHNGYPREQHLFVDWVPVARLGPGGAATLELAAGVHTVTGADSANPDDNPSSVTELFEPGYRYEYRIVAK